MIWKVDWRSLRLLPALLVSFPIASCSLYDRSPAPEPLRLVEIDEGFLKPCAGPIGILAGDQPAEYLMRLWAKDRNALRACRYRHGELAGAVAERDAIQGAAQTEARK